MKKSLLLLVILFCVGIGAWTAYKVYRDLKTDQSSGQQSNKAKAVPVKITPVKRMDMKDIRSFSGTLKPWSSFEVAPKISGRLEQLTVSIGDEVKKGQLLARVDDGEYQQQVEQAKAELEIAEAQLLESQTRLQLRKKEMNRLSGLFQKKVVAEAEHDSVASEYNVQMAEKKMKEAQVLYHKACLKMAQVRLSYTRIYANWEEKDQIRYVGNRFVDTGAMLNANHSILSILDIKKLKAAINVIERDYPLLKVDQLAEISTDAYPGKIFKGRIYRISKLLDEQSRQAEVQISIPNDDLKLKPGMFVRVSIEFACSKNTQAVPRNALVKRNGRTGVFRVSKKLNKAFFVPVKTGISNSQYVEILSPLIKDPVVTLGYHLLANDSDVRINNSSSNKKSGN